MKKMMEPSYIKMCETTPEQGIRTVKSYSVDEEPVRADCLGIEEETGASIRLLQEICSEGGNPTEDREPGTSLENKQSDHLLQEQPDNDRWPKNTASEHTISSVDRRRHTMERVSDVSRSPRIRAGR